MATISTKSVDITITKKRRTSSGAVRISFYDPLVTKGDTSLVIPASAGDRIAVGDTITMVVNVYFMGIVGLVRDGVVIWGVASETTEVVAAP